jgi:hypothetical protein
VNKDAKKAILWGTTRGIHAPPKILKISSSRLAKNALAIHTTILYKTSATLPIT